MKVDSLVQIPSGRFDLRNSASLCRFSVPDSASGGSYERIKVDWKAAAAAVGLSLCLGAAQAESGFSGYL